MIKKLSQEVINKIAAGEIVQKPYSVIKEMVENSIDANATVIKIIIINGGFDQIRIVDNGNGIMKEDFELLCERYATSKVSSAEDLKKLSSFGFRGEALASISFVSMMTVTSRRKGQDLGYQGQFRDQKLLSLQAVGCAEGTDIVIEQLFYNMEGRKIVINKLEEKKSIIRFAQQLALHHGIQIQLTIDKVNEVIIMDKLKLLSSLLGINEKCFINEEIESDLYHFKANYICTQLSSLKYRKEIWVFINNRLVESDTLRKHIYQAYSQHYQCIHDDIGGLFVYLSLMMDATLVDPNIHPNKKEVRFINELEIGQVLQEALSITLSGRNNQKQLIQKTLKPKEDSKDKFRKSLQAELQKTKVRADPLQRTLDQLNFRINDNSNNKNNDDNNNNNNIKTQIIKKYDNIIQPCQEILDYIKNRFHEQTKQLYQNMVYIGLIGQQQILVQVNRKLVYLNIVPLLFNMFWCQVAYGSLNLEMYSLEQPIEIQDNLANYQNYLGFNCQEQYIIEASCSKQTINNLSNNLIEASKQIAEDLSLQEYSSHYYRDVLFPYLKGTQIIPIQVFYQELLSTEDLYYIFERC